MTDKQRLKAVTLVVGIACIVAISMGAATLDSAELLGASDGDIIIEPPDPATEVGDNGEVDGNDTIDRDGDIDRDSFALTTCITFLDSTLGLLFVVAIVIGLVAVLYAQFNFAIALFGGWVVAPPAFLVYLLATDCTGGGDRIPVQPNGQSALDSAGQTIIPAFDVPLWAMVLLIGGVFVVAGVVIYRSLQADPLIDEPTAEGDEGDLNAFAEAAGRAADRIELASASVDNAVYEAWVEMTELLDESDPSYTAGEFADAAIDAGMERTDVEELTELFNEVRYGGHSAGDREDRAVEILRNIESSYRSLSGEGSAGDDENVDGGSQ